MRIVSLLPAATEIVCELGLNKQLVGISHGCNFPPSVSNKPRVSATDIDYDSLSSLEIDHHVEESMRAKRSLYHLNNILLDRLRPTHILTQALCDVCAITPSDIQKVIKNLSPMPEVIELNPRNLEQIYDDVLSLGKKFDKNTKAEQVVKNIKTKINKIRRKTQALTPKIVFCLEWLDPLYACGHWVPEMVEIAGGLDPLSFPNKYSSKISWDAVEKENPDIIILIPCSFSMQRTIQELSTITDLPLWQNLKAVKDKNVWITDGSSYFNQSGIRTLDKGVEILAKIIHPEVFGTPKRKEAVNITTI